MRARIYLAGLMLGALSANVISPARAEDVPPDVQETTKTEIGRLLVRPLTSRWNFAFMKPYVGSSKVICGTVDYQNLQLTYVGPRRFYAILRGTRVTRVAVEGDPSTDPVGEQRFKLDLLCGNPETPYATTCGREIPVPCW